MMIMVNACFHQMSEIPLLAECLLVFVEGLCSIQLFMPEKFRRCLRLMFLGNPISNLTSLLPNSMYVCFFL
jgi:hypothetical protein